MNGDEKKKKQNIEFDLSELDSLGETPGVQFDLNELDDVPETEFNLNELDELGKPEVNQEFNVSELDELEVKEFDTNELEGLSATDTPEDVEPAELFDYMVDPFIAYPRGFLETVGVDLPKFLSSIPFMLNLTEQTPDKTNYLGLYKDAEAFKTDILDAYLDISKTRGSIGTDMWYAIGQMTPVLAEFMLTRNLTSLGKYSKNLLRVFSGTPLVASQSVQERELAQMKGATPSEQRVIANWNVAIGALDVLAAESHMGALKNLPGIKAMVKSYGKSFLAAPKTMAPQIYREGAKGFVTEAGQEWTQEVLANFTAKQVYDSSRGLFDNAGYAFLVGGLTGGFVRATASYGVHKMELSKLSPEEYAHYKNIVALEQDIRRAQSRGVAADEASIAKLDMLKKFQEDLGLSDPQALNFLSVLDQFADSNNIDIANLRDKFDIEIYEDEKEMASRALSTRFDFVSKDAQSLTLRDKKTDKVFTIDKFDLKDIIHLVGESTVHESPEGLALLQKIVRPKNKTEANKAKKRLNKLVEVEKAKLKIDLSKPKRVKKGEIYPFWDKPLNMSRLYKIGRKYMVPKNLTFNESIEVLGGIIYDSLSTVQRTKVNFLLEKGYIKKKSLGERFGRVPKNILANEFLEQFKNFVVSPHAKNTSLYNVFDQMGNRLRNTFKNLKGQNATEVSNIIRSLLTAKYEPGDHVEINYSAPGIQSDRIVTGEVMSVNEDGSYIIKPHETFSVFTNEKVKVEEPVIESKSLEMDFQRHLKTLEAEGLEAGFDVVLEAGKNKKGKTIKVKKDAAVALRQVKKKSDILEKLRNCL